MNDEEILERIMDIEIREEGRRGIKSYVLRNNVLSDEEKKIIIENKRFLSFFDSSKRVTDLFDEKKPLVIEIGFGMGDITWRIAKENPETSYLALDVYLLGCVKLLRELGKNGVGNVNVMRFNAPDVLSCMTDDGSVDGFHIFVPDPWPKKRHHKRRLLNLPFLHLLAKKLKKGGYIYFVTDWEEYADEVLALSREESLLVNPHDGFAPPCSWRPTTKFERKGIEKDHKINEIWLVRQ